MTRVRVTLDVRAPKEKADGKDPHGGAPRPASGGSNRPGSGSSSNMNKEPRDIKRLE